MSTDGQIQRRIAQAIGSLEQDDYRMVHYATHAAAGGILDELLEDPEFVANANAERLSRVIECADGARPESLVDVFLRLGNVVSEQPVEVRLAAIRTLLGHEEASWGQGAWRTLLTSNLNTDAARVSTEHEDLINDLCVTSLDGSDVVISASSDGTVLVWDWLSGRPISRYAEHNGPVSGVAVANVDGRQLVASSSFDKTLHLWDPATGETIRVFRGHRRGIWGVSFAKVDGRELLFSASADYDVRMWDARTGGVLQVFDGHTDWVWKAKSSTVSGRHVLASCSDDFTVRVWDVLSGSVKMILKGHEAGVCAVDFIDISGEPHIVSASYDGTIRLWRASDGKPMGVLSGHTDWIRDMSLLRFDHKTLLATSSDDGTVRTWELEDQRMIGCYRGHLSGVTSVAYAKISGEPRLISGGFDQTVRMWGTGDPAIADEGKQDRDIQSIALIGARYIATATDKGPVELHDLMTRTITTMDHCGQVTDLAGIQTPGRGILAVASPDGVVRVWDPREYRELGNFRGDDTSATTLACGRDNNTIMVAAAGVSGTVRVWDVAANQVRVTTTKHTDWVSSVAFGGDGLLASSDFGGGLWLWDTTTGESVTKLIGHSEAITGVCFVRIAGRHMLLSGGAEGELRLWDVKTGDYSIILDGRGERITSVSAGIVAGRPVSVVSSVDGYVWVSDLIEHINMPIPLLKPVRCGDTYGGIVAAGTDRAGLFAGKIDPGFVDLFRRPDEMRLLCD